MNPLFIGPIFDLVKQVLGGLGLDPEAKQRAQTHAFELLQSGTFVEKADQALMLAQLDVNKAEAQGQSAMQRLWRPAMGWACVLSLAYAWVGHPLLGWLAAIQQWPLPPALDTTQQMVIVGQMLGLAAARTVEKLKGME